MPAYLVPVFFETEAPTPAAARLAVLSLVEGHDWDSPDQPITVTIGNDHEVTCHPSDPLQTPAP